MEIFSDIGKINVSLKIELWFNFVKTTSLLFFLKTCRLIICCILPVSETENTAVINELNAIIWLNSEFAIIEPDDVYLLAR